MRKVFELPERFVTGEPTMMVVSHWTGSRHILEKAASFRAQGVSEKLASQAFDYIQTVDKKPGETLVLVNALGTFEHYDDNRNGDGFNELPYNVGVPLVCTCPACSRVNVKDGWVTEAETVTRHYQSFERLGGIYQHHQNKDPKRSLGRVQKAFFNAGMHRVELLLALKNALCPEWIQEIESGLYAPVSMGCNIRYDVCARCGHRAPTRKEYCEHLKFAMRKIDPVTGVRNCALNPSPRFFDISKVFRPADPTGYMMKKVAEDGAYIIRGGAELGEKVAEFEAKQAAVRKFADIQKVIVGETVAARKSPEAEMLEKLRTSLPTNANVPHAAMPEEMAADVASVPDTELVSSLAAKNAGLTTSEFMCRHFAELPESVLDKAAFLLPSVIELFAEYPSLYEKLGAYVNVLPETVNGQRLNKYAMWIEKRATTGDWLGHVAAHSGLPGTAGLSVREPAHTDMMYVTDPNTYETYRTNRGAVMAAHDQRAKADLFRHVGATLGLAGAYRLGLGGISPAFNAAPAIARYGVPLAAGYATAEALFSEGRGLPGSIVSDEGYDIPTSSELVKSSSFTPKISMLNFYALVRADMADRLPSIKEGSLRDQLLEKIASYEPNAAIVKMFTDSNTKTAVWSNIPVTPAYDFAGYPEPDLDAVCVRLGSLLVY